MRCATKRAKHAGHERCAVQYPGLRSGPSSWILISLTISPAT